MANASKWFATGYPPFGIAVAVVVLPVANFRIWTDGTALLPSSTNTGLGSGGALAHFVTAITCVARIAFRASLVRLTIAVVVQAVTYFHGYRMYGSVHVITVFVLQGVVTILVPVFNYIDTLAIETGLSGIVTCRVARMIFRPGSGVFETHSRPNMQSELLEQKAPRFCPDPSSLHPVIKRKIA